MLWRILTFRVTQTYRFGPGQIRAGHGGKRFSQEVEAEYTQALYSR